MPDALDMDLVREFVRNQSEAAFTELVQRHLPLVYSVARRYTGNDGDAQDVAQAVFIILARKAGALRENTLLPGWLYETTRFTATRLLRANVRRRAREQEAYMQSTLNQSDTAGPWEQLAPHLESAMARLRERDRALLVLRFYQNKTGPEVAALMGIRENTLHKRAARALNKLRMILTKHGVTLSGEAVAGAISLSSVQAAPAGLAKTISATALAKGATASASTLTLVKGALKIMAWTNAKTAAVAGAAILLVAGTATVVEKMSQPPELIYQGKPLSVWLKTYNLPLIAANADKWHETTKIVQQAGTNAIPTLLRLLREEDKRNLDINGGQACYGFAALGATAKDSVPSLIDIYEQNPAARGSVLYSLNCIGTNADVPIDWLLPKLKDPDPKIRAGVADVVGQMHTKSEQAIPALIQCLSDSSSHVRADAALALGSCGADAKPAIPQLITLLNDKGRGVKNCAAFAIKEIDPEAAAQAGIK